MNLHDPTEGSPGPLQLFFEKDGTARVATTTKTYTAIFKGGVYHFNVGYNYQNKVAYITPWMPGESGGYVFPGAVRAY